MNAMAPTRRTELNKCRVQLTRGPAAPAEARAQVQAAIGAWDVSVDSDVAVLLTSELVTNAVRQEAGGTVTLAITCSRGQLRVDVHDASCCLPVLVGATPDAESGRGLMLVDSLSADWGAYRTTAGKAVYFTLAFQPEVAPAVPGAPETIDQRGSDMGRRTRGDLPAETGPGPHWVKSSLSYANGNCVEVADFPGGAVGVRNSRDPEGPVLRFTPGEWDAFLQGVKNGEFDMLGRK